MGLQTVVKVIVVLQAPLTDSWLSAKHCMYINSFNLINNFIL